jgi:hypothetical protein
MAKRKARRPHALELQSLNGRGFPLTRLQIGSYDTTGAFNWRRASVNEAPYWVYNTSHTQCSEAWFRGVGLEWRSYEGAQGTEVVTY